MTNLPPGARRSRRRSLLVLAWILGSILAAGFANEALASTAAYYLAGMPEAFSAHLATLDHYRIHGRNTASDGCGGG
jgi:hypothetical protein